MTKYTHRILFLISFIFHFISTAAHTTGNDPIGARAKALGDANVALIDYFSAHNNQAGLGFLKSSGVAIYAENRFLVEEVNRFGLVGAVYTDGGSFGLDISYFGYSAYKEVKLGVGFGKSFTENFSAGVQFDYFSTQILEYGQASVFTVELGLLYQLLKNVRLGAHLFNPVQSRITEEDEEYLPATLRIGGVYEPTEKVGITIEAEKNLFHPIRVKGGVEYRANEYLHLRAGTGSNPAQFTFGAGIYWNDLSIDIASSYHQVLGFTPHISIGYEFGKKK